MSTPLPAESLCCLYCGYDLRTSAHEGHCSECGQPFRRTQLYHDVIRQRLHTLIINHNFLAVFFPTVGVFCTVIIALFRTYGTGLSDGVFTFGVLMAVIMGMTYLMSAAVLLLCVGYLLIKIYVSKEMTWREIQAVKLHRDLMFAFGGAVVPLIALCIL